MSNQTLINWTILNYPVWRLGFSHFSLAGFFFFSYSADVCNSTENQAYGKQALNEVPGLPAWLPVMIGIANIQVHREEPVDTELRLHGMNDSTHSIWFQRFCLINHWTVNNKTTVKVNWTTLIWNLLASVLLGNLGFTLTHNTHPNNNEPHITK